MSSIVKSGSPRRLPVMQSLGAFALLLVAVTGGAAQNQGVSVSSSFTLDPKGATAAQVGYFPIQVPLSDQKPAGIVKEPVYRAAPKYAIIRVGDGPQSVYLLAVDEPEDADYRLYFDKNRNGDLTDDGDGAWASKREANGRTMYGLNEYLVRASWGTADKETSSGEYGLAFYRFVGQPYLLMFRQAARTGTVTIGGKTHKALLIENDADGIYSKPLDDEGKPVGGGKATRPVWLLVDLDDDGKFSNAEVTDIRSPFKWGTQAYEAKVTADGSSLKIAPTTRKVVERREPERPPLLKAGTAAPDFTAEAWGGSTLRLSDYRGKIVVLDFWATWCGPCMRSLPHLEKVHQNVKDKGVVVLALNVFDERNDYTRWVEANRSKYTFQFALDPAGHDSSKSIAAKLYNVSGIPTTYIIDREGKVVEAIVGYQDGDTRLEAALKKLGVDVSVTAQSR